MQLYNSVTKQCYTAWILHERHNQACWSRNAFFTTEIRTFVRNNSPCTP